SVVLHSRDPVRAEWERRLLQEELFGQTDAGIVFFEKLAQFHRRGDSEALANILEVYLLCLLLGFEGRYSGGMRAELDSIAERSRKRIESIRGHHDLSPAGVLGENAPSAQPGVERADRFGITVAAAILFTVFCFLVFKFNLIWTAEQLRSQLP